MKDDLLYEDSDYQNDNDPDGPATEPKEDWYTIEEGLQIKHDVRIALRRLPPLERVVVALMQRYTAPPGYIGPWPPTPAQIGEHLRATTPRWRGRHVSPRTVVTINRRALQRLRRWLQRQEVSHAR